MPLFGSRQRNTSTVQKACSKAWQAGKQVVVFLVRSGNLSSMTAFALLLVHHAGLLKLLLLNRFMPRHNQGTRSSLGLSTHHAAEV